MTQNYITVKPELKEIEIKCFIQEGDCCLGAAQLLFKNNAYFMTPAVTLCHHAIELFLKSCCIWGESKYLKSHRLLDLANDIRFLNLEPDLIAQLKKIDTFYAYRYPLEQADIDRIERILKIQNIPSVNTTHQVYELGDYEWNEVEQLYKALLKPMPDELYKYFEEVGTTLKDT